MSDAPPIKLKSHQEHIDSFFEIKQKDNNYTLNMRANDECLTLKIIEENSFLEDYEKEFTESDIQTLHNIFAKFSFKAFINYIKSQIDNNKLEILKSKESVLIRLKQDSIDIIINKKKLDTEIIMRNICNELIKLKNNQKKLEEKSILDNKKISKEIDDLKTLNNELKKENEEIKDNLKQLIEENKNLKEANEELELKIEIDKSINEEIINYIKEEKKKLKTDIKDIIKEKNNIRNKLLPFEELENEQKNKSDEKKIRKLNLDNINNNIFNEKDNIGSFNLKKNELNGNYNIQRMKSFPRRNNTLNNNDFKNLDIIQEDYKQEEPNEFLIFNKRKRISDIYEENTFNYRSKILDKDINSLEIKINKIPNLNMNKPKLRNTLSSKDLLMQQSINNKNKRYNKNINLFKDSNNNLFNKTNMDIENMNMNNIIGNFSDRRKINVINKINKKENFSEDKIRNYSTENKRTEISMNNLKGLKQNFMKKTNNYYVKKICFNKSKNKNKNTKKIQINNYFSKYGTNTENIQHKSKKIFNDLCDEKLNIFFRFMENLREKYKENINNKNIIIKPKNNYKLKPNYNLKNCSNIIKNQECSHLIGATLLCLINVKQLVEYFLSNIEEIKENYIQKPLSSAILEIIENLWKNKSIKYYTPINCINIIQNQNDNFFFTSKKLIVFLLDNLHKELNKAQHINHINKDFIFNEDLDKYFKNYEKNFKENYQSIISNLFYLKYDSKITCFDCNSESHNIQWTNMLEFSLEEVKKYNNINKELITIYDCFNYFNNKLDQIYTEKCYNCEQEEILGNINKLLVGPKILIISINGKNNDKNKMKIEEVIDLSDFFHYKKIKYNYELISIMMYLGDDNYITFFKSFVDKKWYKYIDLNVIPCSFKETNINCTPSLFFYSLIERK